MAIFALGASLGRRAFGVVAQTRRQIMFSAKTIDKMKICLKRVYEGAEPGDGFRVLVDRVWPRGVKKECARLDRWAKEVAPSTELRKWFGHDPARFDEFSRRYEAELAVSEAYAQFVAELRAHDVVTLLYAAKDETHNNAVVLAKALAKQR